MRKILLIVLAFLSFSQLSYSQSATKKVLIEEVTTAGCPGCPVGALEFNDIAATNPNVIPVAIHFNDVWHTDSMATPDGAAVLVPYWWAQPTMMVDRYAFSGIPRIPLLQVYWSDKISEREAHNTPVDVSATGTYSASTRSLDIDVTASFLNNANGNLRVNCYIVEDSVMGSGLGYDQLNGYNTTVGHPLYGLGNPIPNYVHRHVLRDMLGGPWGTDGVIPSTVASGNAYTHHYTTTLPAKWDESIITLVVLVQQYDADSSKREVLNANSYKLADLVPTGSIKESPESSLKVFPNPSSEKVFLEWNGSHPKKVQLSNITGSMELLKNLTIVPGQGPVEIHSYYPDWDNLPAGIYLISWQSDTGNQFLKIVKL